MLDTTLKLFTTIMKAFTREKKQKSKYIKQLFIQYPHTLKKPEIKPSLVDVVKWTKKRRTRWNEHVTLWMKRDMPEFADRNDQKGRRFPEQPSKS